MNKAVVSYIYIYIYIYIVVSVIPITVLNTSNTSIIRVTSVVVT